MEYTNCKWCGATIFAGVARCRTCGKDAAGDAAPDVVAPEAVNSAPRQEPRAVPVPARRTTFDAAAFAIPAIAALLLCWKIYSDIAADKPAAVGQTAESAAMNQLSDRDPKLRYEACQTLQTDSKGGPPPAALSTVLTLLKDPAENVRGSCAAALGYFGAAAREGIPTLISMLKDSSSFARMTAAQALGKIASQLPEDTQAVPALTGAMQDEDALVRQSAALGLRDMGDRATPSIPVLLRALKPVASGKRAELERAGSARAAAVQALGRLASKSADIVPALTRALDDPVEQVRSRAIWELGDLGALARPAVPALGRMIHDKDEGIRGEAVGALGKCCADFDETLPYLIEAVSDRVLEVRKVAVFHLGKMGTRASTSVPALIPVLSDKAIFLRAWTAEALGNIGPSAKAALPRLHQMLNENPGGPEAANLLENVQQAILKIQP